ncbi:hypothetical protein HMI54_001065 [Coelomomyces lativittatus]|nr:hypothetical protein HMI55_006438 [Coelomomyces lativittatus]KAJ1518369.1 hypothetical protein HMI54_001065 [Coelomomyces lativittatus]
MAPTPLSLPQQKDFLMTKYKDSLINDFTKKLSSFPDCKYCRAPAMRLRRDGYAKIFLCLPTQKDMKKAKRPFAFSEATIFAHRASLREELKRSKEKKNDPSPHPLSLTSHLDLTPLPSKLVDEDAEMTHSRELNSLLQGSTLGKDISKNGHYLNPLVIQALFELVWHHEKVLLDMMLASESRPTPMDIHPFSKDLSHYLPLSSHQTFFMEVLVIPANKFRPPSMIHGAVYDNVRNTVLKEVLLAAQVIREKTHILTDPTLAGTDPSSKMYKDALYARNMAWLQLQNNVNAFIDSTKATTGYGHTLPPGIRQLLEKKEGLFRKHMMGKRVNYAARSVISPDPWIETNEIGVPFVFAKKLTFPEPVTGHNVHELRQCVLNGPDQWPGATDIQLEDGRLQSLYGCTLEQRTALASQLLTPSPIYRQDVPAYRHQTNKKVFRHLRNGDIVLLNRQPTLHKPSIMAHKVRVLPGERTLRLHYANCNTYNADFDGDEMNIHFAQNQVARAEAYHIANSNLQYLVPTDGAPLRGLIQDHVVTGVLLCKKNTFFEKHIYHDLLMGSLPNETMKRGRILTLTPAICKPIPLWTGKQVITTLLFNLTYGLPQLHLISKGKVGSQYWGSHSPEEAVTQFCQGELVTGVLDKSQIGASSYGFVHSIYEVYGGEVAGLLLGSLSRLFSKYLIYIGFTVRLDDLLLTFEGDTWRKDLLSEAHALGAQAALEYTQSESQVQVRDALERVLRDKEQHAGLDAMMKSKTNQLTSSVIATCLPQGLFKTFPENGMQLMTVAGAKGSNVNVSQISCCLGQQELEGRRVPVMPSGKTLPSFQAYDPSVRAGGFIAGRFLTGLNPQEYFFHCMAGREGLIDTAVKTARSGYLQRCLIKHLEGLRVHYDGSVRDSDGTLIQFIYGEDGLDVTKQKHLTQFQFCVENHAALNLRYKPGDLVGKMDERKAHKLRKAFKKEKKEALQLHHPSLAHKITSTVQSELSLYAHLGSVSDKFYDQLKHYQHANPEGLICKKKKKTSSSSSMSSSMHAPTSLSVDGFEGLMYLKYIRSLVEPGEGVGILASQSIGEPSTQMTLNTFHFAGFGAKNVTLGIPRLREIIMTASTQIKTPTMTLTLKPKVSEVLRDRFCRELSRLTLSAITKQIEVRERIARHHQLSLVREYRVRIDFFSSEDYQAFYHIDPKLVKDVIKHRLLRQIDLLIKKERKLAKLSETLSQEDVIAKQHVSRLNKISHHAAEVGEEDARGGDDERLEKNSDTIDFLDDSLAMKSSKKKRPSKKSPSSAMGVVDQEDEDEDRDEGDAEDALDAGEDEAETGATSSKYAKKKKQVATYDDDDVEDDDDDANQIDDDDVSAQHGTFSKKNKKSKQQANLTSGGLAMELDEEDDEHGDEEMMDFKPSQASSKVSSVKKESDIEEDDDDNEGGPQAVTHSFVKSFEYFHMEGYCLIDIVLPALRKNLLMVPLLEKAVRSTVIREVAGISRCVPDTSTNGGASSTEEKGWSVAADGVNLHGMWDHSEILDVNSIYTNDIFAMYKVYGVEAARASIIKEIAGVFSGYGISVDVRHLTLIADYMTFEGGYKPFNRFGINSNPSPFLKMSFETSCQFLKAATVIKDIDTLHSPSSKLVVGQVVESGSGAFEIIQPLGVA